MKKLLFLICIFASLSASAQTVSGTLQATTTDCTLGCNASQTAPFCTTCGPNVTGSCTKYTKSITVSVPAGSTISITSTNAGCGSAGQFDTSDEFIFVNGSVTSIVAGTAVAGQSVTRCFDNPNAGARDVAFGYRANRLDEFMTYTYTIMAGTGAGCAVLPIELQSFSARTEQNTAVLSFATATEINNNYFSIERSQDGARFEAIGKVTGAGTSTVKQEYTYTDERPLKGTNFYRLKQVDFDGKFSYSPVVSVTIGKVGGVRLSPQPVLDRLNVALEQPAVEAATWQVYDFAGRLLQSGTLEAESTNFEISTTTLAEGTYVLRLVNGQQIITQQFQKN